MSASLALHVVLLIAIALMARRSAARVQPALPDSARAITQMVWLKDPGAGGGGGGGGNRMSEPPRHVALRGTDAVTVPAAKPRALDPSRPATIDPEPISQLTIPVAAFAGATESLAGSMDALPGLQSQGPGSGGGGGTGDGLGDGPGRGDGFGPGLDHGVGDRFYHPGNGVTMPIEIRKGTPQYTAEAMRARVQGSITVQCVVEPSGACDRIRVLRSLNPAFGLDVEAIKAAAQWRFRPGTRLGQPVPVLVTMEIAFALR